ncbi:MAG TPA: MarR family winged helix-turn-helix transcriptional regulator [Streptosporangiaceae bacterium]|nr:MarR family winged helix-turn-helix transcriptional regulator [Streptosporangiaceae bacterium]
MRQPVADEAGGPVQGGVGLVQVAFVELEHVRHVRGDVENDLAQDIAITVGATSKAVDRLKAAGWVTRRPNPANRRSSLLALTTAGRRLLAAATPTVDAELQTWLADPLGARDLDQLATSLARLRQTMADARAGQPTG